MSFFNLDDDGPIGFLGNKAMRFCHYHEQKEATKEATQVDIQNCTEHTIAYRTIYICDSCGKAIEMYIGKTARVRPIAETEE